MLHGVSADGDLPKTLTSYQTRLVPILTFAVFDLTHFVAVARQLCQSLKLSSSTTEGPCPPTAQGAGDHRA